MTTRHFEPTTPLEEISVEQLLGEAVGAASMAWGGGPHDEFGDVFDSDYATTIVDTLKAYIETNYTRKEARP